MPSGGEPDANQVNDIFYCTYELTRASGYLHTFALDRERIIIAVYPIHLQLRLLRDIYITKDIES